MVRVGVIELREVSWLVGVVELLFPANDFFFHAKSLNSHNVCYSRYM